ncbi:MAG: hypothetical protein AAF602_28110, partial [Myxococcota bacterium]
KGEYIEPLLAAVNDLGARLEDTESALQSVQTELRDIELGLPNLLADEPCIPEHVQVLDPEAIAADVDRVRGRPQVPASVLRRFGGEGAIDRAADEVLAALQDPVR